MVRCFPSRACTRVLCRLFTEGSRHRSHPELDSFPEVPTSPAGGPSSASTIPTASQAERHRTAAASEGERPQPLASSCLGLASA